MSKDSEMMQGPREMLECGHVESEHSSFTRGYGTDAEGNRHCYDCCSKQDIEYMKAHGRITLYLSKDEHGLWKVGNWPGSATFKPYYVRSWKAWGFGGWMEAHTAYFIGPDNHVWSAINKGDNQIARCRRTKEKRGN